MVKRKIIIFFLYIFCGTLIILIGGCKKQEPARLTITVEGRELSDAHLFIDDKQVGSLTQTIIAADGMVYVNGKFTARMHHQDNNKGLDIYAGCSDPIHLNAGKHTIILQKNEIQPLKVVVSVQPGYHLLTILSEKALVKWGQKTIPIDSTNTVTISSEKNK